MKKLAKILYYFVLGIVVAIAIILIISVFPVPGNIQVLTVISGSMEPNIPVGSVVLIKPANEYKKGDVITFNTGSKSKIPTSHRIVNTAIQDGEIVYMTKGDANNSPDVDGIKKGDVIGKVLFHVPFVGFFVDFIKKPVGFFIFIIIPAIIIVYEEFKKILNEIKNVRKKYLSSKNDNE